MSALHKTGVVTFHILACDCSWDPGQGFDKRVRLSRSIPWSEVDLFELHDMHLMIRSLEVGVTRASSKYSDSIQSRLKLPHSPRTLLPVSCEWRNPGLSPSSDF